MSAISVSRDAKDWMYHAITGEINPQVTDKNNDIIFICLRKASFCFSSEFRAYSEDDFKPLDQLEDHLLGLSNKANIILDLAEDRALFRKLSTAKLPHTRAVEIANLDMDEAIPFLKDKSDLFILENERGRDSEYAVIQSSFLEQIKSALQSKKFNVISLVIRDGDNDKFASQRSIKTIFGRSKADIFLTIVIAFMCATLVFLAVGTFLQLYLKNSDAISTLDTQLEISQKQASLVREKLDERQKAVELLKIVSASKSERVAVSVLWEELSMLLPDQTWLTDISIRNEKVIINGFSNSAADLISLLSKSPYLTQTKFVSPVVRVPGQDGERFSIELVVVVNV